jgi:hypothetical protein
MTMHHLNRQHILVSLLMIPLVACASTPTQTATSAVTLTAKPTFTSRPTPTNTPSPISTPEATIYEHDKSTSPDGKWSTSTLSVLNEDDGRMTFTITNKITEDKLLKTWKFPDQLDFQ